MDIARLDFPVSPADFYYSYFTARQPVIIRTRSLAQLGWRTELWSNEYLVYRAGAHEVRVLKRSTRDNFLPEKSSYVPMLFKDFIAHVMAKPGGDNSIYLNLQNDAILESPALQLIGDFGIPDYFKDLLLRTIILWMGNSREPITTPLHHDFNDNLYVVVEGRKHFTLFPPEQIANLYPRGKLLGTEANGIHQYESKNNMPHIAQVDIQNPDLKQFPLYAQALPARLDFTVEKNEMLFLPAGWFHQVTSEGRHIAVSFIAVTPSTERIAWMRETLAQRQRTSG